MTVQERSQRRRVKRAGGRGSGTWTIVAVPVSDFAALFLARHPRLANYVDTDEVNAQAGILHAHGLEGLNAKVLASPSGEVLDVIAEHNIAAMLARREFTDLQHEPPSMSRPI